MPDLKNNRPVNTKTPKVSIGMPVYNGEKFICKALDSLLCQTFSDFELIISDNASTDTTEAICREYATHDSRIRYVRQKKNQGPLANFQYVLDDAVGEYFMWAAADDYWDEEFIDVLLSVSSAYQCLAYGFVQPLNAEGQNMIHPANQRKFDFRGSRFIRRLKYYLAPGFLGKANLIYGIFPSKILKTDGLSSLQSNIEGADMLLMYEYLNQIEIRHAGTVFQYKRIHDGCYGMTTRDSNQGAIERVAQFIKLLVKGPMLGQYIMKSSVIESVFLLMAYPVCMARIAAVKILFYYKNKRRNSCLLSKT